MSDILKKLIAMHGRFQLDHGCRPDRIVLTDSDLLAVAGHINPDQNAGKGYLLLGCRVECGRKTEFRFAQIEGIVLPATRMPRRERAIHQAA